jgi:hypothetical protein
MCDVNPRTFLVLFSIFLTYPRNTQNIPLIFLFFEAIFKEGNTDFPAFDHMIDGEIFGRQVGGSRSRSDIYYE